MLSSTYAAYSHEDLIMPIFLILLTKDKSPCLVLWKYTVLWIAIKQQVGNKILADKFQVYRLRSWDGSILDAPFLIFFALLKIEGIGD